MLPGIDVSVWQGKPTWWKVKQSGKFFSGIKATQGVGIPDGQFSRNWQRSRLRGVRRIAYCFTDAAADPAHQASYFLGHVDGAGGFVPGDAAMLDIETLNGEAGSVVVEHAEECVRLILEHTQVGVLIYTGLYFWRDYLGNPKSTVLAKCPLWLASWGTLGKAPDNWPGGPSLWQYSSTGRVDGIIGDVDLDYFLGTPHQYDLIARYGGRR